MKTLYFILWSIFYLSILIGIFVFDYKLSQLDILTYLTLLILYRTEKAK